MEGFNPPSELSLRRIAELRIGKHTSASRNSRAIRDQDPKKETPPDLSKGALLFKHGSTLIIHSLPDTPGGRLACVLHLPD